MSLDLAATLQALKRQRVQLHKELAKLDKAIKVLRELSATTPAQSRRSKKRTLSAAGRRKIARAQKLRWAKVKQGKSAKS